MSTEHMHVTNSRAFNDNNKKIARNCLQHYKCVFRVELDESQCKCVEPLHSDRILFLLRTMLRIVGYYVAHCRVNVFKVPFIFFFLTSSCIIVFLFLKSGDFASGDMTVSFRVWLSGRDDFRRAWYNSTYCLWVKMFSLFVIRECYLVFTM